MPEKGRTRKNDIVFLNIIFCLLVIFIHIASEVVSNMPRGTAFFKIIFSAHRLSSFVVQGFILLSGVKLFLHRGEGINYLKYYKTRVMRVYIPYILWVVVYYIYFCAKGYFEFSLSDLFFRIIYGDLSAHFYFVIILIQFDILAPLWMALFKRGNSAVNVAFSLIITVICGQFLMPILTTLFPSIPNINFDNCFLRYLVYWTAGCMIGRQYDKFQAYLKRNIPTICVGFLFCATLNVALTLSTIGHFPIWLDFIHIMYCMSAILFFYMIAQAFSGGGALILKPLSAIDKSSYTIYLMHCLVLVIVNDKLTEAGVTGYESRFYIRAAAVYGISIAVAFLWQLCKTLFARLVKDRG